MIREDILELDIELYDHSHGHRDRKTLENHGPEMRKSRTQGRFTVDVQRLGDDGHDGEEDPNEAVLEDSDPNDLAEKKSAIQFSRFQCFSKERQTLNQVNPLLGLRKGPRFSPPVHFCR
jgi:hypothetical protein